MSQDIIRILRIVEYTGPREAVEMQVKRSLHGEVSYPVSEKGFQRNLGTVTIRATTLGAFPEILEREGGKSESVHRGPGIGPSEQPKRKDSLAEERPGGPDISGGQTVHQR